MDLATPVGIVLALVAILGAMIMEGGNPAELMAPPALLLVFLGTFAVALAGNRLKDMGPVVKAGLRGALAKNPSGGAATVDQLMEYADVARRNGLLALEEQVKDIDDPFLKRGLEMVIDGTDSEEVTVALYSEIDAMRDRHKTGAKFFADMGGYAPTLGIIGTVLGLIHALGYISDPEKMGHAIGMAFMATLWGVLSANVFWLPLSNKLKRISAVEIAQKQLIVQGVLAIQAGVSPRQVGERLKSHLAPTERDAVGGEKPAEKLSA